VHKTYFFPKPGNFKINVLTLRRRRRRYYRWTNAERYQNNWV